MSKLTKASTPPPVHYAEKPSSHDGPDKWQKGNRRLSPHGTLMLGVHPGAESTAVSFRELF